MLRLLLCLSGVTPLLGSPCKAGVFVELVKQPDLGLRHFPIGEADLALARLTHGACSLKYVAACRADGKVGIEEKRKCDGPDQLHGPAVGIVENSWEVCDHGAHQTELQLLASVVDLTFENEVSAGTAVVGCVRLTLADGLPALAKVRGPLAKQQAALAARKAEVGGCPTWKNPRQDAVARAWDFAVGGYKDKAVSAAVYAYQSYLLKAANYLKKSGPPPPDGTGEPVEGFTLLGAMIGLNDQKNTEAYLLFTKASCGWSVPMGVGVMAPIKFDVVASMAGSAHQQRDWYCPWSSACNEICWDKTLPIFLSSDAVEHTQVRRLWDEVTLESAHVEDFPYEGDAETSLLGTLRHAIGLTVPTEDETANLVSPLLMERIFRKKPSAKEAAVIAEYVTYGKLCIKSALAAKLPLVNTKIQTIRDTMAKFGLDSPVALKMAKLLEEPRYAELKKQTASRGKPLLEMALTNLADASLFAGMLGTTDMTWKCVKYLFRDPAHVRMFRKDPTNYLWELMRLQPAVQGFTTKLQESMEVTMFGESVVLPKGAPYKYCNSMANRDPTVWSDPLVFNPDRPWSEMGEVMSWNGQLKHVVARNYTGAPRHCPGHDLSVKIAAHVCARLTRHLEAEGAGEPAGNPEDGPGDLRLLRAFATLGGHRHEDL